MKSLIYLFILLLFSCIVFFRWLSFDISVGGDWIYYYSISLRDAFSHYLWTTYSNLGSVDLLVWRYPVDVLKAFFGHLQLDSSYTDKLLVFWPTIILANIISFFLVRKVTKSNLAGFLGAIIFNYNTYFFTISSAYLLYSSAVWSVFALYLLIIGLEKSSLKYHLLSSLTLFVAAAYDLRVAYIAFFLLLSYFLFFIFYLEPNPKDFRKKVLTFFFSPVFLFILLNVYWIIGFLSMNSLTSNEVVSRSLFGSEFLNILYSLTLFHPFWTGGKTSYFIIQQIPFHFWVIPIIAFLSLWLHKKNKQIVFFGLVAVIGIFLTKQTAHPFGEVYTFLFNYFPGFNAYREASKFYFLIILGYSVLIGAFANFIWKTNRGIIKSKFIKCIIISFIFFLFLSNTKPIFTGEIGDVFIPQKLPTAYKHVNKLFSENSYFRTLWVPYSTNWIFYANEKPAVNLAFILATNWKDLGIYKKDIHESSGEQMLKFLGQPAADRLFDMSSIRYVVVPFADRANKDLFVYYGIEREDYLKHLDKLAYLQEVNIGTSDIIVYENTGYRPHVYTTFVKESLNDVLPATAYTTTYQQVNPTEYIFTVKNVTKPFYLHFAESYNSGWKMRIGDFNWLDTLMKQDYFVADTVHFKNEATLNSFYIEPGNVCKEFSCMKNPDGSYTISGTIYFKPQSALYSGLIISGITLVGVVGWLVLILRRSYEKK